VRIVYLGHATVLVELDGVRLLTDPALRKRLLLLRRVGGADAETPSDLDGVLVSHLHFDHLDVLSLRRIGRDVPIVVPRGAGRLLFRKRFRQVDELGVGDELSIGPLSVRAVPAVHPGGRAPLGISADPVGFVVTGSRSVYFAGDTELFDGMAEIAPVDVALLPVAGWGPKLGLGHMDPREAAEAARRVGARVAIPIHWGTYFPLQVSRRRAPAWVEAPPHEFETHVKEIAPAVEVRVLWPGEATTL
jgi:L-ascorbate metabolism protein UlaG (beta-lactamase superfamily)